MGVRRKTFSALLNGKSCISPEAKTRDMAIGEIVGLDAKEGLIDLETKRINWDNYNPIGRLYANQYIRTHDRFSMSIPSPEDIISGKFKNFTEEK